MDNYNTTCTMQGWGSCLHYKMTYAPKKREYPTSDGWEYITVEEIRKGQSKAQIISSLTNRMPELYEVAFWHRYKRCAFLIMRRKPVESK